MELGINALDFIGKIPKEVREKKILLNWDPPYFDKGNKEHEERFNGRKARFMDSQDHILMDPKLRSKIYKKVKNKFHPTYVTSFSSDPIDLKTVSNLVCWHVWVKTKAGLSGNGDAKNLEWIVVKTENSERVDNKRSYLPQGLIHAPIIRNQHNNSERITLAKPYGLMRDLVDHFKPEAIIDLFAGRGELIKVALDMDIDIFACDIDFELESDWNRFFNPRILEDFF